MNDNEKIAMEIQDEMNELEAEQNQPRQVSRSQVEEARIMWMAGTVLVDALTCYLVYVQTGYWYYAALWLAAGAGGLLWSERQKERIGNNAAQESIGDTGVKVSAALVFLMAIFTGTVWILKLSIPWMDALMEITALSLFFYHLYQAYQYHNVDDDVIEANREARLEAKNEYKIRQAHRAGRLVKSRKIQNGVESRYRGVHGAAFDAALGQTRNQPGKPQQNQQQQNQQPQRQFASNGDRPELKGEDFSDRQSRK